MSRMILDKLPAGAYLCDADGLITYYNARAEELWGRAPRLRDPADRYCGSFRLYAADGTAISHDHCWMALALRENREHAGREIIIERPDGERRRAIAHATPLHDERGALLGAVNVLVDVTAHARLEERLGLLLDNIEDHLVQYDRQWRYTFVTEKGAAFIGKKPSELLGRSIWELFPEAIGNLYYRKLHEAAETGRTVRFEHHYAPFGRWFENNVYPTPDGVTVFATDITQRKTAELALRQAEERHAALLDLVPAGVYRCDAEGFVRYYNARATELWGRAPDLERGDTRFCGSLRLFTVGGQPVAHEHCLMADVLRTGVPVHNQEVVIERPDGSRITALVNIQPLLDPAGRIEGAVNVLHDITERKQAELELARSRQQLSSFVEGAVEGLHWVDAAGVITWANRAELEMLGYTAEEYIGHSITEFHADQTNVADMLRRLKSGEVLRDHEAVLRCKDGSVRHVSINSSVLYEDGRFAHTCCFTRDITARRQADEMRSRLAAIVESSEDAIVGKDLDGRVTSWNAAAERLYGYSAQEMVGRPIAQLCPPDRVGEEDGILARIRAGERVDHFATTRLHKSGRRLEISTTVSPVRDGSGRIVGASSTSHDISARLAHERALRDSEARYRSLAEASGAIVFVGDGRGEWVARQPAWEAYTGQAFDEYRGRGWLAAIHNDDRAKVQGAMAKAITDSAPWSEEGRIWHAASRSYRHQEWRAVPIREPEGTVREWVGTCLDVHARKTAEDAVREADRRKDEFLAVLAHELRNPLAPIASSLQILRLPKTEATHTSVLDVMDRQVHHLVRLVDDLMEVSRITRGAIELRRETVPLAEAVRAAVEISRPLIDAHDHRLELDLPPGPATVMGDRVRLTQIVANLLNNAAKYTPRGGRIRVRLQVLAGEALVSVLDNGVGIAPRALGQIFEMFRRGDGSMERFASGLGIGLGLSRRLAELHGGTVQGYSAGEGHGAEFTLRLPTATVQQQPVLPADVPATPAQPRRVLVVDDNQDAAVSLAALLRALGHEVLTAEDGGAALRVAEAFKPDVALVDLGMPAPDGFEVARQIRRNPWGSSVKLVAVSGWGQEADRRRSSESGFDLHLVKPVELEDVKTLLAH